jgi:protein SCO1/2
VTALLLTALLVLGTLAPATAEDRPPILRDVGIDQRLDASVPLELRFRDEEGRTVRLGDYFGERPVILNLVYFGCPMLCTHVANGLVGALTALAFTAGDEFRVLTVSIDPRDTPAQAHAKKAAVLERYGRPGAGWHFLTGDEAAIATLADAVGFRYAFDAARGEYAHGAGVVVLTPRGRVSRYLLGVEFAPRDLRLALVEASANRIGTFVDQILLFCYHWDPATGKYGALVMNLVRVAGLLTVLALGTLILALRRREATQG